MTDYHCPQCGKIISFGEAICPNCKADVTSVWEQASGQKKDTPKVIPGTGGMPESNGSPFPPPSGSPFPPPAGAPFPPPAANAPFPPAAESSPFPPTPSSTPFPPQQKQATVASKAKIEIPIIGGVISIPDDKEILYIGRDEIQGCATKSLPDLNAYNNLSKVRKDGGGNIIKEHFIIHNKAGEYSIEDKHSTNGTYLGTMKLQGQPPQVLKDGDKIILPIEEFGKMVQLELIFKKD